MTVAPSALGDQQPTVLLVTEDHPDGDYTHLAITGTGVLCPVIRRRPWTRTVGTWKPWDGEQADCDHCRWLFADHLYDQET